MEQLSGFFNLCEKVGIEPEFTLLALIGMIVSFLLYLHFRSMMKKNKRILEILDKISDSIDIIKDTDRRFEDRNNRLDSQLLISVAQQESMKEKIDGLHDDLKEIKKQLLFK